MHRLLKRDVGEVACGGDAQKARAKGYASKLLRIVEDVEKAPPLKTLGATPPPPRPCLPRLTRCYHPLTPCYRALTPCYRAPRSAHPPLRRLQVAPPHGRQALRTPRRARPTAPPKLALPVARCYPLLSLATRPHQVAGFPPAKTAAERGDPLLCTLLGGAHDEQVASPPTAPCPCYSPLPLLHPLTPGTSPWRRAGGTAWCVWLCALLVQPRRRRRASPHDRRRQGVWRGRLLPRRDLPRSPRIPSPICSDLG